MDIKYKIETATTRLVQDETIHEVPATSDLSLQVKGIPTAMVDKFHAELRDILFEFGWNGSIS